MSHESDRNDADLNPKRTVLSEPSSRKPSNHSGEAHALTPRGRLSHLEKFFGRYVPSWDYVDVLCWRYWRYKDASFVFYRGAVLSLNHIWSRWCAADRIYKNQSYEWQLQREGFRKVMNRLAVVWDKWEDLKYEIENCGYRSPEDSDSFATRVEDVHLLNAIDKLFTAEQELSVEEVHVPTSVWYHSIFCKEKHKVKFDPFRDPQRREQMRNLYEQYLPEIFGDKKLELTLFNCLYYDLVRANEFRSRLPCRQNGDPIDEEQLAPRSTGRPIYPLAYQDSQEGPSPAHAMSQRRVSVSWRVIPYLYSAPSPRDDDTPNPSTNMIPVMMASGMMMAAFR